MEALLINVLLLQFFSLIVMLSVKGKRNVGNALIIFHSLNLAKIVFWCVWSVHKTGTIDLNYLQYVDEHYYFAEWHAGAAVSNLYHLAVIGMKRVGFGISSIKMVNILLSSFAVVRLYTLKDLVRNKNQYIVRLFVLCGVVFLHVIYCSVFLLKDAVFFYLATEYLIQLIQRPIRNRWWMIAFLSVVLMLIRPPMVIGFMVFLFDRNWTIRWRRVLLFASLTVLLLLYCDRFHPQRFYRLLASGMRENLGPQKKGIGMTEMTEYAERIVSLRPRAYLNHVLANMRNATLVFDQVDLTNQLILLLEWCTAFYLLVVKKNITRLIEWWPILSVALLYFVGGILTVYNIRYHIFPITFLICLSVFVASHPFAGLSPGYHGRTR